MHDWYGVQNGILLIFVVLPALVGGAVGYVIAKRGNHLLGTRLRLILFAAVIGAAIGAASAIALLQY